MQKFLESKKNQEEKQKKIRIEQQRAKEDEVKSKYNFFRIFYYNS
jgi:hypothetical protein